MDVHTPHDYRINGGIRSSRSKYTLLHDTRTNSTVRMQHIKRNEMNRNDTSKLSHSTLDATRSQTRPSLVPLRPVDVARDMFHLQFHHQNPVDSRNSIACQRLIRVEIDPCCCELCCRDRKLDRIASATCGFTTSTSAGTLVPMITMTSCSSLDPSGITFQAR